MTADVSTLIDDIERYAAAVADAAALIVLADCKAAAPVSEPTPTNFTSGQLRDSLALADSADISPVFARSVVSPLDYAQYTDTVDTMPHEIRARNAPVLRFWWDRGPAGPGIYHYLRVLHPGTRGQHWFTEPMPARWDDALDTVKDAV